MTALTIKAEESKAPLDLEPGFYDARLVSIESADGQYGAQAKWVFELPDVAADDGSPGQLWAWSSWKLTARTKMHGWVLGLGGVKPVPGQQYSLDALFGRACRLLVDLRETDDGPRPHVQDVLPPVRKAKPAAPPAAVPEAESPPLPEPEACFCGGGLHAYSPSGQPLCERHAAEIAD